MSLITSSKIDAGSINSQTSEYVTAINDQRLIALGSGMMILGTIRIACGFVDLGRDFVRASRLESLSWSMVNGFVERQEPLLALGVVWPFAIGLLIRRKRSPQLIPAAGLTFLFLSLAGLAESLALWSDAAAQNVTIGSFHPAKAALKRMAMPDIALGALGAAQLSVELVAAVCAWIFYVYTRSVQPHASVEFNEEQFARRARVGRLALYASIGFLVLMLRMPVWSTYLELVNDSRIVREFIIRTDPGSTSRPRRPRKMSKAQQQGYALERLLFSAAAAARAENFAVEKEKYVAAITLAESVTGDRRPSNYKALLARAHNNFAWMLATCPETEMRDPPLAVEHARAAVELVSNEGTYWNTLGVALYRNGKWDDARESLNQSMSLRLGGDGFDWFFLAIIDHKQARHESALELYQKAERWSQERVPRGNSELYRIEVEAASVLGLPVPKPVHRQRMLRQHQRASDSHSRDGNVHSTQHGL